jgi:hypothetical protein
MRLIRVCTRHGASAVFPLALIAITLSTTSAPQPAPKRRMACKTPENATTCYWTHGRLSVANGAPSIRLWKIGTHRILAIHSGPNYKRGDNRENESPELPANVDWAFKSINTRIFADFQICPLEPEEAGTMQSVCIESAKNIFTTEP